MWPFYKFLTQLLAPLVRIIFANRLKPAERNTGYALQRLGKISVPRPSGPLIWIHGASIGEIVSVIPTITGLLESRSDITILVTTVTYNASQALPQRLPRSVIHQTLPLDVPSMVQTFISHWRPDFAVFVESEIWPNLILHVAECRVPLALLNARISERSFQRWQKLLPAARSIFSRFMICFAQDSVNASRFRRLGIARTYDIGNLKKFAPPLSCDDAEVSALRKELAGRRLWLASSTHEGEERVISNVHMALKKNYPDLLTIIVPRHPDRGDGISSMLSETGGKTARRSLRQKIALDADFYLADTFGELGTFYRLSRIVFMGATLVSKGGHNPLEAARFGCAIIHGPHVENNAAIYAEMDLSGAAIAVGSEDDLLNAADNLMASPDTVTKMAKRSQDVAGSGDQVLVKTLQVLNEAIGNHIEPAAAERGAISFSHPSSRKSAMPGVETS